MEPHLAQHPPATSRRVLVSFSPLAGARSSKERARKIVEELEEAGYTAQATCDLSELQNLSSRWHDVGELRCVLACGGDGTAAFVRNHTPLEVPLLLVPMGTENLLGHYVAQSAAPAAVRETVDHGVSVALDLGLARSERFGSRYFLSMISAGFDAEVVRRLHDSRRGNITRLSYIQPMLQVIRSYEYPELQLYCHEAATNGAASGEADPLRCRWAFGFNLPLYARGWKVAPDAVATDGLFDVCTFQRGSVGNVIRYLWHVLWKSHLRLADAQLGRYRKVRIEAADGSEVAFQVDGDYGGSLPVEVEVLPGQLRLLVMPHVAHRLGFATESK